MISARELSYNEIMVEKWTRTEISTQHKNMKKVCKEYVLFLNWHFQKKKCFLFWISSSIIKQTPFILNYNKPKGYIQFNQKKCTCIHLFDRWFALKRYDKECKPKGGKKHGIFPYDSYQTITLLFRMLKIHPQTSFEMF